MGQERLKIENLGPIKKADIELNDLTVLVGPQASGKSLVTQLVYFFRNLPVLLKRKFRPDMRGNREYKEAVIRDLLDELRGVPFGYFANDTAKIGYTNGDINWGFQVYNSNRKVSFGRTEAGRNLAEWIDKQVNRWAHDPRELETVQGTDHIFIPTERSLYTRLVNQQPEVLFAPFQPMPFREFANYMAKAQGLYNNLQGIIERNPDAFISTSSKGSQMLKLAREIVKLQRQALMGKAYLPSNGPRSWKWQVWKAETKRWGRILPLEAIASGQTEAWPFFVLAVTNGGMKANFYFEEPETHLHPAGQKIIMETVSILVEHGCNMVLTTHSPFILMTMNNMLQRFEVKKSGYLLDPAKTAAYLMPGGDKLMEDGLVRADQFEDVADQLGEEFEELLKLTNQES